MRAINNKQSFKWVIPRLRLNVYYDVIPLPPQLQEFDKVLTTWKNDVSRLRALLKQKEHQYQEVIVINVQTRQQVTAKINGGACMGLHGFCIGVGTIVVCTAHFDPTPFSSSKGCSRRSFMFWFPGQP